MIFVRFVAVCDALKAGNIGDHIFCGVLGDFNRYMISNYAIVVLKAKSVHTSTIINSSRMQATQTIQLFSIFFKTCSHMQGISGIVFSVDYWRFQPI